jgi:hypothetical protein
MALTMRAKKARLMAIATESSHLPSTRPGILMENPGSLISEEVWAMRQRRHQLSLRPTVAAKLVGGNTHWQRALPFQQLAKEPTFRCRFLTL